MASATAVKVGRTDGGYCVRIEGKGTMKQSPAVMEFIEQTAHTGAPPTLPGEGPTAESPGPAPTLAIDLTGCDYLDSTFLGCLLGLHQQFAGPSRNASLPPRFTVAAPPDKAKSLFGPTRLDKLLRMTPAPPPVIGEWVLLPTEEVAPADLSLHVMECHRKLAEVEGPNQAAFARIAEQMARDLCAK